MKRDKGIQGARNHEAKREKVLDEYCTNSVPLIVSLSITLLLISIFAWG